MDIINKEYIFNMWEGDKIAIKKSREKYKQDGIGGERESCWRLQVVREDLSEEEEMGQSWDG